MKWIIILLCTVFLGVAIIVYIDNYTYTDIVDNELLFLNPFQPDEQDFRKYYSQATKAFARGDSKKAKGYYTKAVEYRNSWNEHQYKALFSCGINYWEYEIDKLLKFSVAYERLGEIDSAIACLAPGLTAYEKCNYPLDKRFFALMKKKHGKQQTIEYITAGLKKIQKLGGNRRCDYAYTVAGFSVGIAEYEATTARVNRQKLLRELLREYAI